MAFHKLTYKILFLVVCNWPYILTPAATCVNILIDRNNCGEVGHKCNNDYKSCSGGVCSMTSNIQLTQPNIIWQGAINKSVVQDNTQIILPFNITLYNTTTSNLTVITNGVSLFSFFTKY
jgi:hypothetical protein